MVGERMQCEHVTVFDLGISTQVRQKHIERFATLMLEGKRYGICFFCRSWRNDSCIVANTGCTNSLSDSFRFEKLDILLNPDC